MADKQDSAKQDSNKREYVKQDSNVVVRLEVLVPQVLGAPVKICSDDRDVERRTVEYGNNPRIDEPKLISVRPTTKTRNLKICAFGGNCMEVTEEGVLPALGILAKVFPGDVPLADLPVFPTWPPIYTAAVDANGDWHFGRGDNNEIELPGTGVHTLCIWAIYREGGPQRARRVFNAVTDVCTECEALGYYSMGVGPFMPPAPAAPETTASWKFTLQGVRGRKGSNCGVLNKTWILERDQAQPQKMRWLATLPQSFVDPKQHAWWRLQHCSNSGFWFLDCVQTLQTPLGEWLSYRCHESKWRAGQPNRLRLHKANDYCDMPEEIVIEPA